jgi:hypothetical protein
VFKRLHSRYTLGNPFRVKLNLRLLIHQDVAPANLRLQRLNLVSQLAIRVKEVTTNDAIASTPIAPAVTSTPPAPSIAARANITAANATIATVSAIPPARITRSASARTSRPVPRTSAITTAATAGAAIAA